MTLRLLDKAKVPLKYKFNTGYKSLLLTLIIVVLSLPMYYLGSDNRFRENNTRFLTTHENIRLINKCKEFSQLSAKQQCWEELIDTVLNTKGLDGGFEIINLLYEDPEFASDCHGYTHLLGEKAYELFSHNKSVNIPPKASFCGFGFYHAFMESLLYKTGDLKLAYKFCKNVKSESESGTRLAILSCFHGIGHGLLEDIPNIKITENASTLIKNPLEICQQISDDEVEVGRCASGVFNVLAIYYGNPNSGLQADNNDPYAICKVQSKQYIREHCFDQLNSYVLFHLAKRDLLVAAKFAEDLQRNEDAEAAIHGITGVYGQTNVGKVDYSEVIRNCKILQTRLHQKCFEGFLLGMLEGGKPNAEHLEGSKFCGNILLNEKEKTFCYNTLVWNVGAIHPEKLDGFCRNLKPEYQQNCKIN